MALPITRRTVLTAGAATAGLSLAGVPAWAGQRPSRKGIAFTLDATVLDGGEQITSVTLDSRRLGPVDARSLTTGTFTVHAKATSPIPLNGDTIFSEYDLDRTVTAARVDRHGRIVLELESREGAVGGGTLGYLVRRARNVRLDLVYTITQNDPIRLRNRREVTIEDFVQGELVNPEVDAFSYHRSAGGLKYRLFSPERHGHDEHRGHDRHGSRRGRPLIVWLHGGGEGASLPDGYYDNETTLRANRGALGFATDQAQDIFDGAYVVAPQSTSFWIEDGPRFAPLIREIVTDLARRYPIDRDRIYVAGCSNGGYLTLKLTALYRDLFAAAVPICGVVQPYGTSTQRLVTDAELRSIRTPSWLVASADDTTVPPQTNTVLAAGLIPDAKLSLYDTVTWKGYRFPGHWSWIYLARNDPKLDGTRVWNWMARQRR